MVILSVGIIILFYQKKKKKKKIAFSLHFLPFFSIFDNILPTIHLRKKINFSEVHESMNATGHVQSKVTHVTLTLHGTRCVHTAMNLRKIKFISYIYTLFLHRFCSLFVDFYLNLANKRRRKVINGRVWLLRSTVVTMTWRQSNVSSVNQLLHFFMTSLTRNVAWTSVVHGCMNNVGPK